MFRRYRRSILGIAIGVALVLGIGLLPEHLQPNPMGIVVALMGGEFFSICAHELGHAVVGMLNGFECIVLSLAYLELVFHDGTPVRLRIGRKLGAFVICLPKHMHRLRERELMMLYGGPAGSFVGALIAAASALQLQPSLWRSLFIGIAIFSALQVIFFAFWKSDRSDHSRINSLKRCDPDAQAWLAMIELEAANWHGVRPRDSDPERLRVALLATPFSSTWSGAVLLAYQAALDRGDLAAAGHLLDDLLSDPNLNEGLFPAEKTLEAGYYFARYRNDVKTAESWISRHRNLPGHLTYLTFRPEAAVLRAKGDTEQASKKVQQGLRTICRRRQTGHVLAETDHLRSLLAEYAEQVV